MAPTVSAPRTAVRRGGIEVTTTVQQTVRTADGREAVVGRVLVGFRPQAAAEARAEVHRAAAGESVLSPRRVAQTAGADVEVVELANGTAPEEAARRYLADSRVAFAEPDYVVRKVGTPNDARFGEQWGMTKIEAPAAWDITHSTSTVLVAVLDCGIYDEASKYFPAGGDGLAGHPDIRGKVAARANFTTARDTDDFCNHGTHVAGIVAAKTNSGVGVAGVGYDARLLNAKVLDDSGSGSISSVIAGIDWARQNGAKAINMSLGASGACPSLLQDAITNAWNAGVVVVAAAGNSGVSGAEYPGNCANVIAVGATTQTDARASFSNYGSNVDVAAPGHQILSTDYEGSYALFSGTSMAAPHVAGLAALMWSLPSMTTAQQVVNRITSTADQITGTGTNWQYGRINAARAVGVSAQGTATATATETRTPTATATGTIPATATATATATLNPKPSVTPTATATTPPTATTVASVPVSFVFVEEPPPVVSSGGGGGGGGGGGSSGSSSSSTTAAAQPGPTTSQIVQLVAPGQVAIQAPGRMAPVTVEARAIPRVPDEWCGATQTYAQHIRLEDTGIAGATFGVLDGGTLDWIPPQNAGCVDWSRVDQSVNFTKEVIMQFKLLRPQPGALLWVLDGDAQWSGRLYEVGPDGIARYVTGAYFQANQQHFTETWKNVMPVSWTQAADFQQRGLVGPDLGG